MWSWINLLIILTLSLHINSHKNTYFKVSQWIFNTVCENALTYAYARSSVNITAFNSLVEDKDKKCCFLHISEIDSLWNLDIFGGSIYQSNFNYFTSEVAMGVGGLRDLQLLSPWNITDTLW